MADLVIFLYRHLIMFVAELETEDAPVFAAPDAHRADDDTEPLITCELDLFLVD